MVKKKRRKFKKQSYSTISLGVMLFVVALTAIFLGIVQYKNHLDSIPTQEEVVEQERNEFISTIAPYAVELKKQYGILPSITIAQAIVESDWGKSSLASKYNNYFGVKGDNPANTKVLQTKEFVDGQWITVNGRFRVYANYKESMEDHAKLFVTGTSWDSKQYQHVLAATDYVDAAFALQTDGYATDPGYTKKILKVIKQYDLDKYDK
ncbi:N-acetylmuramidase [Companilactobacillus sp. RD055328]|uniref:glycoside hydrolase family 73 protein n=1 Tax=Companilactobacillus sp. RD055328 TaxID=2916634 RepID=UPI001FC875D8|nr:glycoside hydrolase family 73 protein [Companilactobacillus sp. RD055328]GKQ43137.1 N-acetylmuramidase [Companilactobacillus sp. RD055328]